MKNYTLIYGINSLILLLFLSCEITLTPEDQDKEARFKTNQPPTKVSIIAESDSVPICVDMELACLAEDPEHDSLFYEWSSYKVTESSTIEKYEIENQFNCGELITSGNSAVWRPGHLNGKYLILCKVNDKVGNEIIAKKIVRTIFSCCLSLITDKVEYQLTDADPEDQVMYLTVRNFLDSIVTLAGCGYIMYGIDKKINEYWSVFDDGPYPCLAIYAWGIQVPAGQETGDMALIPAETGKFRFFLPFNLGSSNNNYSDTLYSNEFEIIE